MQKEGRSSMDFGYFYGRDGEAFQFLKVPLIFFESELFQKLSIESKVLYSFLLSRAAIQETTGIG